MAEKTVILRPYACISGASGENLIFYPEDTPDEDAHLLVSEVEADDAATYVTLGRSLYPYNILFEKPNRGTIIGIKAHYRIKSSGTICAGNVGLTAVPSPESSLEEVSTGSTETEPGTSDWNDYIVDYSTEESFLNAVNSKNYSHIEAFCLAGQGTGSQKAQTVTTSYTQIYLEFICEESTPLYIRENGTWEAVEGTVYRKENGTWVENNTDVFAEGDNFALVNV